MLQEKPKAGISFPANKWGDTITGHEISKNKKVDKKTLKISGMVVRTSSLSKVYPTSIINNM